MRQSRRKPTPNMLDPWSNGAHVLHPELVYAWICEKDHWFHDADCLWIWHYCRQELGPASSEPGALFGWKPSGVSRQNFQSRDPLTLAQPLNFIRCCGMRGTITHGHYRPLPRMERTYDDTRQSRPLVLFG